MEKVAKGFRHAVSDGLVSGLLGTASVTWIGSSDPFLTKQVGVMYRVSDEAKLVRLVARGTKLYELAPAGREAKAAARFGFGVAK